MHKISSKQSLKVFKLKKEIQNKKPTQIEIFLFFSLKLFLPFHIFNFSTNTTCYFAAVENNLCVTQRGCLGHRSWNEGVFMVC